jgi:multidrug efflux pump subunit AcrB
MISPRASNAARTPLGETAGCCSLSPTLTQCGNASVSSPFSRIATGVLFAYTPKGFLPSDDVGQLFVITEAAQDISFDAMANLLHASRDRPLACDA